MFNRLHPAALLLLIPVMMTAARGADRHFEKKFTVQPGGTFTITTDVGSVKVTGTPDNEVTVVADLRGRQRDVNDFEISAVQSGTGVEVTGRQPKRDSWFWHSTELDIRYVIKVPRSFSLSMNTAGGDIDVSALRGTVRGETSGGAIRIADIEGPVTLNTSGGDIRAERLTGDLQLETSGGAIAITTVTGGVDVSSSGGSIRVSDVDGKVRAETSGGDVLVKLRKENKGVFAETSGGDIEIRVGKGVAATIDASTSGGEVICDLPVTMSGRIDESRVHGDVNGGGKTIHAHTSGGDVRIRTLE